MLSSPGLPMILLSRLHEIRLLSVCPWAHSARSLPFTKRPLGGSKGLSGHGLGMQGFSVQIAFDCSPEDGSCGVILGFMEADKMRYFDGKREEEIQAVVTLRNGSYNAGTTRSSLGAAILPFTHPMS
ncbi:hypothetical protein A1O3_08731 [Capronia epimyces CBS 606.96]|uniref:Uncharacterized protein n=1 Tax=Capronia epimyces CBS 606.96 TaxID=1182542 RepID=W9XPG1_9EURO|nr:uncharacterized protein A1O3_08731 [Capronia epimyces CBS 606.96]EXJ79230.1 hypothetical protein A1O3_08731 [Capronia epimyces CBS 606.96]